MGCYAAPEWDKEDEPNGECPECGELTIDGVAIDQCSYSPILCDTCGYAPCDGSC